jgi:signal transduction histidine kinase
MASGSGDSGKAAAPTVAEQGSLARIVRVESRQVVRLGLLFSLWMLLPLLLLLIVQQQIQSTFNPGPGLFGSEAVWAVLCVVLAIVMSLALAFSIARQQALAGALERAVNNLPMQFAYIDAERCFRFSNRAHLMSCVNPEQAFFGRPVREVLGEETYRQIEPHLDQALMGERVDFELHLPDGDRIGDLAVSYLPDTTRDGRVKGLFVLADDITARKRSERRNKEQLLEFAQLSRMASVGEVAAEIAHQINQPLSAIALLSSAAERTLAGGGDLAQLRGWLETINGQSKRASEVIGSLRRFVRTDAMEPVVLDLNVPLREVAALLAHDAAAHQVGLSLELADALPRVKAAGILIEQVVFNLTRNAIRAAAGQSQPGQVTIRSRADAERVWVEVLGNGPMPSAYRNQTDSAADLANTETTGTDGGLAFSLATSRSIIDSFNGEVGCQSDDCSGTFCYFNLPRCKP